MISFILAWGGQIAYLFLESGPWLLFGFLAAGFLQGVGFTKYAQRFLVRPGFRSVVAASAIGIPLPLCSCSVIPVGVALRRNGASRGATASFFISTPQVGVDSFLLTVGLFGIPFGIARIVISFLSALLAGTLIDRFDSDVSTVEGELPESCCSQSEPAIEGFSAKAWIAGILVLVRDLRNYLIIGFVLAGLVSAIVPGNAIDTWFSGAYSSYLAAVFIGIPTYVCATSSTPLAAVLLAKGISAGAVLVFLMVGPATNIATVVALKKELGVKGVGLYLISIVLVAVVAGLGLDTFLPALGSVAQIDEHQHGFGVIEWISSLALVSLFAYSFVFKAKAVRGKESGCGTNPDDVNDSGAKSDGADLGKSCCSK